MKMKRKIPLFLLFTASALAAVLTNCPVYKVVDARIGGADGIEVHHEEKEASGG